MGEYEEYIKNEQALAKDYEGRIINNIADNAKKSFKTLKEILDTEPNNTYKDGYYFPENAISLLEENEQHHLNCYMDLTVSNILNMINDNDTIENAIHELFEEYKPDYAFSWSDNFICVLNHIQLTKQNKIKMI